MPPIIPNADFEDDSNWTFVGSGGIASHCVNDSFTTLCPEHGTRLAWLAAWTTSGNDCPFPLTQITAALPSVSLGSMQGSFSVDVVDADYYSLEGFAHGGQEGFGDNIIDFADLLVFLDGAFWGSVGIIFGNFFGYTAHWAPFNYGLSWGNAAYGFTGGAHSVYLSPGTHTLTFVAASPHLDALGNPLPSARRQIVVIDNLSLQRQTSGTVLPGTTPPPRIVRLVHAGGGDLVRLSVNAGTGRVRLVHHG